MIYIPTTKLEEGAKLSIRNAENLLTEAALLLEKKYFARSTVLSILAYEEMAKSHFLYRKFRKGKTMSKQEWEELKKHGFKAQRAFTILVNNICSRQTLIRRMLSADMSTMAKQSNNIRLACVYVNWDSNRQEWMFPINDDQLRELVRPATLASNGQEAIASVMVTLSNAILETLKNDLNL